ncbi:MAG: ribonuclease P protein component [Cryobacterium sp.]|uniref:ribonuclease P protein component n=1 Tax=Cryobacterium sp. TaxID=1926290 RepID=UPI0022952AAE|nr:ribonuclease P protein component [Cryobacterium sp.]MCY7404097.1 ribonuclease P protein component [Cryobacterium sp.]
MLARLNRIVRSDDYRSIVRSGRRASTPHVVVYMRTGLAERPARVGFIVSKAVGNAVRRNLVRRRFKAAVSVLVADVAPGTDIVIRALPAAAQASWATLNTEITQVLRKGMARA